MRDVDEQLRSWADQAEPVTVEEIRRRADGGTGSDLLVAAPRPAPGLFGTPGRRLLAAAAVLALVIGGVVVGATSSTDDGDDLRMVDDPAPPVVTTEPIPTEPEPAEPDPMPPEPTDPAPEDPATEDQPPVEPTPAVDVPDQWIGYDGRGRLVVVDTASGEVVRVLVHLDDPDLMDADALDPVLGTFLGRFTVSPDRSTVYYETCCEPVVGDIFQVPVAGGQPQWLTHGTDPVVSPDGTQLAVVELQALKIVDLATGVERRYEADPPPLALGGLAWSTDGTRVAFTRIDDAASGGEGLAPGRVVALHVGTAADPVAGGRSLDDAIVVAEPDADGSPMFPVFTAAGEVELVYQSGSILDLPGPPTSPASLKFVRLAETPVVVGRTALDRHVLGRSRTQPDAPVLTLFADRTVAYLRDGTWVELGTGYEGAAW